MKLSSRIDLHRDAIWILAVAQDPTTRPWNKNACGPRTVEEALQIAEMHGISFPEEVQVVICNDLPSNAFAAYLMPSLAYPSELWPWKRFLNRFEKIVIRIRPDVLESDEAIVAVLAHEAFELNGLRDRLPDGNAVEASELYRIISPGFNGNLHCQAWDDADRRIMEWRLRLG